MSNVNNGYGFKAGSIYRISLENFVTYKQVELYPGSNLNVIIGPNGTGKSTFVCAIVLGLCGKTNVIGRAKKISEYVRSGCQQATIEIELYRNPSQRNVIITRNFNLEGQSTWSIDKKLAREKQVQDLITSLNIQVDNLCQLLPQDRVQDFAKMNSQQLLRNTLSAVGGTELVSTLDELIECRINQRNLISKVTNNTQSLQELQRLNERLRVTIDAMHQRKEIEQEIAVCEKKKLWIEYQELRQKVMDYSDDKKKAEKLVQTHRKKMEPLQKTMSAAKACTTKLESGQLNANREMTVLNNKIKGILQSVTLQDNRMMEINTELQEKLDHEENKQMEIQEARVRLDKLKTDREHLMELVGDETKVKMQLGELKMPIQRTEKAIDTVKKDKLQVQYDLENNVTPHLRLYQNKIRSLEDVAVKRLQALKSYNDNCYQAVMWLRNNKHFFECEVYEPMVLEVNFTEPRFASYLENTVSARDLVAFTFESTKDMNLFMRKMRGELGLKQINAVCSPPTNVRFSPPAHIDDLRYLGFYTYLLDTISAPEAILRYLCKQYSLHRIPIGDDTTYKNSAKVPANINFFYTAKHRFTIKISAYSGAKSTSTSEIRPARMLANTVDQDQLNELRSRLAKHEKEDQSYRARLNTFDEQLSNLEAGLNELLTRKRKLTESVDKVKTISAHVRMQEKKVQNLENEVSLNIDEEKIKCKRKLKECVLKQLKLHSDLNAAYKALQNKCLNIGTWKIKLDLTRSSIAEQESELRELKSNAQSIERTLEDIEHRLTNAKSLAKDKLVEAKRQCDNRLPQDAAFPYREQFEKLPSELSALVEHCYELQTRIECTGSEDEQVIKEYEEREKTIKQLLLDVNNSSKDTKQLENKINKLKKGWLKPVENLMLEIDKKFSEMFASLNCAGEVKLDRAGSEDDFDVYGVAILVRFRENEELQQLNRHTQSGGERALSTALYLMALQRLATVPFRCVDEINQGMDPINERKMFQLLVNVTTQPDSAQYFLLTPKLLLGLEYSPQITVHTVMNGPQILHYKQWKFDKFLEHARSQQRA